MADVRAVPEGFRTVTPRLAVVDVAEAIDFYQRAFGAEETVRLPDPDGNVMYVEMRIGDSTLMVSREYPERDGPGCRPGGGSPVTIHLYVKDVDAAFERASRAGGTVRKPVADMFWGDRYGELEDPFGHRWSMATHTADLTPQEILEGARKAFGKDSR